MSTGSRGEVPGTARGEVRTTLLDHAVALTRERGPDAVSLREVQRLAGVSSAAAYRHYRDREALLMVVGHRASSLMADAIAEALDSTPAPVDKPSAIARLRTGCEAYLAFMRREPGLFRAVFLTEETPAQLQEPFSASRGSGGLGPYQLLQGCIQDLVEVGALREKDKPWSDTTAWAACHGLAMLLLDGPLRWLDDTARQAATDRLLDVVVNGLAGEAATRE